MGVFRNLDVSETGMTANRTWMDVISNNIANANTTRTPEGGPYKAKAVSFSSVLDSASGTSPKAPAIGSGVQVSNVVLNETPPVLLYNPAHPDADAQGRVALPNVNLTQEMVQMISATRSYEANVAAFNAGKTMYLKALDVGK